MSRLPTIAHRKPHPSDLSDQEWAILKPLLPHPKGFGHPIGVDFREILNGIFYVQRSGCQWEMLPHDLPPYSRVYHFFQKWHQRGIWQQMHDQLRTQVRQQQGRAQHSTVAIADSQSVKTTEKRGRSTALYVSKSLVARRLRA
ncbi:MAG: IS5 family transposase [Thermostichus sp. DG02_5_bins_236]